jgi:DNA-binding response OmpR family regulator
MIERKILIVDDEAPIRDMLVTAFDRAGYTTFATVTGEHALEILKQQAIPLMFLDLGLPTMTGFELCERIRQDDRDAIIYALTGYGGIFGRQEFLEAGFDDYFSKPIGIKALYEAAENAFGQLDRLSELPVEKVIDRILIIDDDEQFRQMLRRILEHEGYEVIEACDGRQGIERFSEMPADLVITDIVMPVKEGVETILEIKEAHPEVKFIAVSGGGWHAFEIDFDMARTLGARTLKKPFRQKELLKVIEEFKH